LSDEQIEIMSDPAQAPHADLPRIEAAVESGGFLAGPPEQIIEKLKAVEGWYPGLDRIMVSHPIGTPEAVIVEQLQRFSEDVMPAFKDSAVVVASDD